MDVDCGTRKVVSTVFSNQSFIFVEAVDDDGWNFLDAIGLINEIECFIEDWVEIIIDYLRLLWDIRVSDLQERV